MSAAHLLEPRVAAAATALIVARSERYGERAATNPLVFAERAAPRLFQSAVEDARAVLAALEEQERTAIPAPRPRGDLRREDAAALGLDLGAATVTVLAVMPGRDGRVLKAHWWAPTTPPDVVEAAAALADETRP